MKIRKAAAWGRGCVGYPKLILWTHDWSKNENMKNSPRSEGNKGWIHPMHLRCIFLDLCCKSLMSKHFLTFFTGELSTVFWNPTYCFQRFDKNFSSVGIRKNIVFNWLHCKYLKIIRKNWNISSHVLWVYGTPPSHDLDITISKMSSNVTPFFGIWQQTHFV